MDLLGAQHLGPPSNKCRWNGQTVVIKCAQKKRAPDPQIGVLSDMLPQIDAVVGVFQNVGQEFEIMVMPAAEYQRLSYHKPADARRTRDQHMMKKSAFAAHGSPVQTVRFDPPLQSVGE